MTYRDAYSLVSFARDALELIFPDSIILDDTLTIHMGRTHRHADGSVEFECGIKELVENIDDPNDIDDGLFLVPFMTLCHEVCGHGGHIRYEYSKDTPFTRVLALNNVACRGSRLYYFGPYARKDKNGNDMFTADYARQPFELAAQYMCFKAGYDYLSRAYGLKQANKLIYAYLDWSDREGVSFVDLSEVLKATNLRVDELKRSDVRYRIDPLDEKDAARLVFNTEDALGVFVKKFEDCIFSRRPNRVLDDPGAPISYLKRNGYLSDWQIGVFNSCTTGIQQDYMMSAAAYMAMRCKGKDLDMLSDPVFRCFDWSLDRVFVPDMPQDILSSSRRRLTQARNMMREVPDEKKRHHASDILAQYQNVKTVDTSSKPKGPDLSF